VTKNLPGLPPWGSFRSIVASRYDAGTAYVAIDFHQVNIRDPYLYKTTDYGRSFRPITNGIPKSMLSYTKVICEDPVRRGLLYAGTENAIYVSFDDGENWQPLQANLPAAPVSWITVQEHYNDLVISTYGRGFWIMDDIGPLQQMTPQVLASGAHLFSLRPAYRFRFITAPSTPYDDPTVGENPEYGASINYYLGTDTRTPVRVTILNAAGEIVRTLAGTGRAGLNRVHWDLRGEDSDPIRMRTSPLSPAPHVRLGPEGWRPPAGGGATISILQPPGTYTVKLAAAGRELTQPLVVRKDPHSVGTEADIEAQTKVLADLRRDLNAAVGLLNRIELDRSQLETLARTVTDADVRKDGAALAQKLVDLEMQLIDLRITGAQDGIRFGARLISRFGYLASGMSNADFRPTDQHLEVQRLLSGRLRDRQADYHAIAGGEMAAFNQMLRARNIAPVGAAK
jgi:hypothetical protein